MQQQINTSSTCNLTPQQIAANIQWQQRFQEQQWRDNLSTLARNSSIQAQEAANKHQEYMADHYLQFAIAFVFLLAVVSVFIAGFRTIKAKAAIPRYYCIIKNPDGSHTFASQQQFESWNPPSEDLPPGAGRPNANM